MLHVLFLFLQEVETDGIESVGAQFVVPEENLEGIDDFSSVKITFSPPENVLSKWNALRQFGGR